LRDAASQLRSYIDRAALSATQRDSLELVWQSISQGARLARSIRSDLKRSAAPAAVLVAIGILSTMTEGIIA